MHDSVLIPAKYSPSCYACMRSLGSRGIRTIVASPHESVPAFASRYCNEAIVVPAPYEELLAYKEALLSIAERPDVRTVLPVWEEDAYLLSKYRKEFEEHLTGVWPTFEALRSVHDRVSLVEAAREVGVPAPETWLLDEVPDWNRELIIKSRYNLLTSEYVDSLGEDESELVKTLKHLPPGEKPDTEAIRAEMKHIPIVQEFVPTSTEYLFGALYDHGEALATFQHRQIRGETYAGGGGSYRESVSVPRLEEVGRTLLDHLDWHGFACIEYMEDANTGELKLTEINPRTWRSLAFAVRADADFPYYYWLMANDRKNSIEPGYEVGVGGHLLHGELKYLLSVLREDYPNVERPSLRSALRDIVWSCYTDPRFDYLRLDDPEPFVRGVFNEAPIRIQCSPRGR